MSKTAINHQLTARINARGQLALQTEIDDEEFRVTSLENLAADYPEVDEIVLEVNDFYQNGTIYQVGGAVLDEDNHRVVEHWPRSASGASILCRFANYRPGEGRSPGFVITAIPGDPTRPHPAPAVVGGGLPISEDDKLGAEDKR